MGLVSDTVRESIDADDAARLFNIRQAWDTYYGRMAAPLAVAKDGTSDNVILPLGRILVDASRSFLVGKEPTFQVDAAMGATAPPADGSPSGESSKAQTYLDATWRANRKASLLQSIVLNGSVAGHAFVKLVERPGLPVKLVNLDPANVRVVWSPDDWTEVIAYVITWTVEEPRIDGTTQVVAKRQLIERAAGGRSWTITDQESRDDTPRWKTIATSTWNRPWAPVVDSQNLPAPNEFYGVSDLEPDVVALIDRLNFMLSNLNRVLRFHGHPKVWASGATKPESLAWAPDEALYLPSGAQVGQLVPELNIEQALLAYNALLDVLHQVTRVPRIALGAIDGSAATPGISLLIAYRPLMEKTEDKRRTYGDLFSELNRRILSLGRFGEEGDVENVWQNPIPKDDLAEAQTAVAKQAAGVSKDTTIKEMGYDPDDERDARQADAAEAADAMLATQGAVAAGTEGGGGFGG